MCVCSICVCLFALMLLCLLAEYTNDFDALMVMCVIFESKKASYSRQKKTVYLYSLKKTHGHLVVMALRNYRKQWMATKLCQSFGINLNGIQILIEYNLNPVVSTNDLFVIIQKCLRPSAICSIQFDQRDFHMYRKSRKLHSVARSINYHLMNNENLSCAVRAFQRLTTACIFCDCWLGVTLTHISFANDRKMIRCHQHITYHPNTHTALFPITSANSNEIIYSCI